METYNLKATVTLEINNYNDTDLAAALASLKSDLEDRIRPPVFTNVVVTTQEQ